MEQALVVPLPRNQFTASLQNIEVDEYAQRTRSNQRIDQCPGTCVGKHAPNGDRQTISCPPFFIIRCFT
ncbi:hypothetical protein BMD20_12140 [Burkholderia multivorans]|nr:hypothetical protein BMD20_12140 [Burkholderia multivorans]MDR9227734.1 hypothetical protein [Burkholderia multivorans]PRF10210.1 hypothetical protein C6Q01_10765 [Burkholderia multivorans]